MSIEDLSKKASDLARQNQGKIDEAMKSEQAEKISDSLLGGAAGLANKLTGNKHSDKIEGIRKNLDGKIGNE